MKLQPAKKVNSDWQVGQQHSSPELKPYMKNTLSLLTGDSSKAEYSHDSYHILPMTQQIWGWWPAFQKYNSKQSTFWQTAKVKTKTSLI